MAAALKQRDTLKSELQTAKSRAVKRITVQMERITELEKLVAAGAANGDAGAAPPGELEAALEAARQEAELAAEEEALRLEYDRAHPPRPKKKEMYDHAHFKVRSGSGSGLGFRLRIWGIV